MSSLFYEDDLAEHKAAVWARGQVQKRAVSKLDRIIRDLEDLGDTDISVLPFNTGLRFANAVRTLRAISREVPNV